MTIWHVTTPNPTPPHMHDAIKIPFLLLFLALARIALTPPTARALKEEKASSTRSELILNRNVAQVMKVPGVISGCKASSSSLDLHTGEQMMYSALVIIEILTIVTSLFLKTHLSVPFSPPTSIPGLNIRIEGNLCLTPAYCFSLAFVLL